MRTKNLTSAILLTLNFLLITLFSFAQWEWQNPLPQGNNLNDVVLLEDGNCWVVGGQGTIIHSNDNGVTWDIQNTWITHSLMSVCFIDELFGWAAGESGTCLYTLDGGETWYGSNTGSDDDLYSVIFIDQDNGWIAGGNGTILFTSNGGLNWDDQESGIDLYLKDICFTDANNGWAVGGSIILHTTDGGYLWEEQFSSNYTFYSVSFIDSECGWALNHSGIFHTENAGEQWDPLPGLGINFTEGAIQFINSSEGWIFVRWETYLGSGCSVFHSNDGGLNWEEQGGRGISGFMLENGNGFSVGPYNGIIRTDNGGEEWISTCSGVGGFSQINDVYFSDNNNGWAVGGFIVSSTWVPSVYGVVFRTSDGGVTWIAETVSQNYIIFKSVFFLNSNKGWVVGGDFEFYGPSYFGQILYTEDGGITWDEQFYDNKTGIYDIHFEDEQNGWACGIHWDSINGKQGCVMHTGTAGSNWNIQYLNQESEFYSITFKDENIGWVVGSEGALYFTDNGGNSWEPQSSGTGDDLNDVYFITQNEGWVVGSNTTILHTNNGGESWETQTSGGYNNIALNDFHFIDSQIGWAVGGEAYMGIGSGITLFTSNGGEDWITKNIGTGTALFSVFFTDDAYGWIVGARGTILHTENGGITDIPKTNNPANYKDQLFNIPNPFSEKTTIYYTLVQHAPVSFQIFDINGKLEIELVNEIKPAGENTIEIDGTSLPSGIYLCLLKTGSTYKTCKIIKL